MINSALELFNCAVFGDLKGSENIFPHSSSLNLYFFSPKRFFKRGCLLFCLVYCTCLVLLFYLLDIFVLKMV